MISNNELQVRCKSLARAGYGHQRIADKLSREYGTPIGKARVAKAIGEGKVPRAVAERRGAEAMKRMGFDRIGGMKTPCGSRA